MFYSDNLLLSVLARSCKESAVAVADVYHISVFDLLHLDTVVWLGGVMVTASDLR